MAVVLNNSEDHSYFSSSSLRRSHSRPKFVTQSSFGRNASSSKSTASFNTSVSPTNSNISSNEFSPQILHADSTGPSYSSTPASSLSLDAHCGDRDEDRIIFPSYDVVGYYGQVEDLEPPASPRTGDSYTVSSTSERTSTNVSSPQTPDLGEHAEDDTAVRTQPSRHVDYLSHNWKEEDIWSSWKLIVSKRKVYTNSARLENASWRTWIKAKNNLKTVSAETLNWLKDCDVTWLYGPLQTWSDKTLRIPSTSPSSSSRLSNSNSFLNKKPILKKRSMSEIMLQRSFSSFSLVKQAAAAIQAQQSNGNLRPGIGRVASDYTGYEYFPSRRLNRDHPSMLSSISSSGLSSLYIGEKLHIHFNEQVEQCIALDMKGDDDDDVDPYAHQYNGSSSDDGAIMMKGSKTKRRFPPLHAKLTTPRPSFSTECKTIAMLPSTTLQYREDIPEPSQTAMKHRNGICNGTKLSPSPSQKTLRPSQPSTRILLGDDDEDDDLDIDWQPTSSIQRSKNSHDQLPGFQTPESSSSGAEPSGMRRTPSGMFTPYDEDEDDVVSKSLFGKVVDTVNTAKDIVHILLNGDGRLIDSSARVSQPHKRTSIRGDNNHN